MGEILHLRRHVFAITINFVDLRFSLVQAINFRN